MVCLGNICRSPVAEGIMRAKIDKYKLSAIVDSAGTSKNHVGEHPDKRSIRSAKAKGVDISMLKSRQFTVADFEQFTCIYVMDLANYRDVLLLAQNEKDRSKVKLILNEIYPGKDSPVPDPYWGGNKEFEDVFSLLDEACEGIAKNMLK